MNQPLIEDVGFLLSRASGAVVRATNASLAAHGLRVRQYSVLALACDAEAGVTQRELADVLGLDPSQVVLLVDELAAAGLVSREPGVDRRTRLVQATRSGQQVRTEAGRGATAALGGPLGSLSHPEREQLRDLLARVVQRWP